MSEVIITKNEEIAKKIRKNIISFLFSMEKHDKIRRKSKEKRGENMFQWNQAYQWVFQLKREYEQLTGKNAPYDIREWASVVKNPTYDRILENLHITHYKEFALLKYNLIQLYKNEGGFGEHDSIYHECRSVVLDLEKEALVLVPFRKFFNLNETEDNRLESILEKIQQATFVEIMDKLDGSMQSARFYNGNIFLSGSQALDQNASWRLEDGYRHLTESYQQMLKEHDDYTFIFEYIGPKNQHVVSYKEEDTGLYIIGMRHVYTGEQLSYGRVAEIVSQYEGVKMVSFDSLTFQELLEQMKNYQAHEKEGWVVNIDGHFLKIKCDDYVNIHKTLSAVSSINVVIEHIAEETYDDFLSKIPENYQDRVKKIAHEIFTYISSVEEKVQMYYEQAPKEDTKTFMMWVEQHVENGYIGYVKNRYLQRPYHALKSGHRYKKAKEIGLQNGYSALFTDES